MNFNSILIGSEDPQRLVEYYTKLFGAPGFSDGGYTGVAARHRLGHRRAALRGQGQERPARAGIIWNIETADVKGDFDRLKAAGAIVDRGALRLRARHASRRSIATFADPDDNYFQLMSPMGPPGSVGAQLPRRHARQAWAARSGTAMRADRLVHSAARASSVAPSHHTRTAPSRRYRS